MLEPIFTPAPQGDVDDLIFADCDCTSASAERQIEGKKRHKRSFPSLHVP